MAEKELQGLVKKTVNLPKVLKKEGNKTGMYLETTNLENLFSRQACFVWAIIIRDV